MDRGGQGLNFDAMAKSKQKRDNERLPPLSEVFGPELRNPGSSQDSKQTQYSRTLHSNPTGPPAFPDAHSLAPSPLRKPQGFNPSHSPSSSASLSSASHGSPALSSARSAQSSGSQYCDPRNLPPIYTNGGPVDDRRSAGYHNSLSPVSNAPPGGHPGYPSGNIPAQDYRNLYNGMPSYPNGGFENGNDFVDGKQKKRRGNLPKPVTDILRMWFQDHIAHPYPTEDEKQVLMQRTGLSISQVCIDRAPRCSGRVRTIARADAWLDQ